MIVVVAVIAPRPVVLAAVLWIVVMEDEERHDEEAVDLGAKPWWEWGWLCGWLNRNRRGYVLGG